MAFSREQLAAYEKSTPAAETPAPAAPAPEKTAPLASASQPATEEPSASEVVTDPAAPEGDETSAETVESATTTADPESETPTAEGEEGTEPAPQPGRARERIEGLIVERDALRKYGEYVTKQLEELKALKGGTVTAEAVTPAPAATPKAAAVTEDPMPTLEDHDFDPVAHSKALSEWNVREIDRKVSAALQKRDATATQQTAVQKFEERAETFAKTHTDFKTVVANPNLPTLAQSAARQVILSEKSAELTYHLAKNPDLAARIARMSPDQQLVQIGKLEAVISSTPATPSAPAPKPAPKQKSITRAPAPPTPVAAGTASTRDPSSPLSMEEFVTREREAKIAQREQRRRARASMR